MGNRQTILVYEVKRDEPINNDDWKGSREVDGVIPIKGDYLEFCEVNYEVVARKVTVVTDETVVRLYGVRV